jgi:hypothetical protein
MGWQWGSIPILIYPSGSGEVVPENFILITDGSFFLLTDNTPMKLAGT